MAAVIATILGSFAARETKEEENASVKLNLSYFSTVPSEVLKGPIP